MLDLLEPEASLKKIKLRGHRHRARDPLRPERKPGVSNLLIISSALSGQPDRRAGASFAGRGYGDLKADLAELVARLRQADPAAHAESWTTAAELDRVLAHGRRAGGGGRRAHAGRGRTSGSVPAGAKG